MKRLGFVVAMILCISTLAIAQDFPKVEVFGGYSLLKSDTGVDTAEGLGGIDIPIPGLEGANISNLNASNWQKKGFAASFTYNATSVFGIEGLVRYNTGNVLDLDVTVQGVTVPLEAKLKDLAVAAGPKFTFRNDSPVTPFAHALIGVDRMKIDVSASALGQSMAVEALSDNSFGLTLGGGIDVKVNDNFAIRLVQADYYMTRHFEDTQNNFALSFGVVLKFGK